LLVIIFIFIRTSCTSLISLGSGGWYLVFLLYKFLRIYEISLVSNCVSFYKLRSSFLIILDGISFILLPDIFRLILLLTIWRSIVESDSWLWYKTDFSCSRVFSLLKTNLALKLKNTFGFTLPIFTQDETSHN